IMLLTEIKRKRLILKIPFSIAKIMAATNDFVRLILGDLVPAFLTLAQVRSLEKHNLVSKKSERFSDFGIVPKKLKIVLPTIVGRYNKS
ncbi:complex I NDUFA9 subunit family protein, partial [Paracoccaceae bacterium]|nr:complex I NDUFA9 subunit family protein [Paracoccaceae bacterium]